MSWEVPSKLRRLGVLPLIGLGIALFMVGLKLALLGTRDLRLAVLINSALVALLACIFVLPQLIVRSRTTASLSGINSESERARLEDERLKLQNEVRTSLLQAFGGIALILGVLLTWQQFRTDRQQLQSQLALTRQGQIAERYSHAVDQLGSSKPETQLGGVYGLEAIAKQSRGDRQMVFETLAAYLRTCVPRGEDKEPQGRMIKPLEERAPGAQAAMRVLGRRRVVPGDPILHLQFLDLRRVDLGFADLAQADLSHSDMERSFLLRARLRNVRLDHARLKTAYLAHAGLAHAHLYDTDFRDAIANHADFHGAYLVQADFRGARLHDANFSGADLSDADLRGALATARTIWPVGFDPVTAGVHLV